MQERISEMIIVNLRVYKKPMSLFRIVSLGRACIGAALLSLFPVLAMANSTLCIPDPGPRLDDNPIYHYGTEPPLPDPERNSFFGSATFQIEQQVTRGGESWVVGGVFFRGEQSYRDGSPFSGFVLLERKLDCYYELGAMVPAQLTTQHRSAIAKTVRGGLVDPYSVRESRIASLRSGPLEAKQSDAALLLVCVTFNARNSLGGYVGTKSMAFALREDGSLLKQITTENEIDAICSGAESMPFSELGRTD